MSCGQVNRAKSFLAGLKMPHQQRDGVLFALGAYGLWGFLAIYFKQLHFALPTEILVHRIIWSFLFTGLLILLWRGLPALKLVITNRRYMGRLVISSLLVACNWVVFIWAIQNNHMLDASLGYFINPFVNVTLGIIFLKERLRPLQMWALGLALIGVVAQILVFGRIPVVALTLATTFGVYGLIRKQVPVDGQTGLLIETFILLVPILGYGLYLVQTGAIDPHYSLGEWGWLLLIGPVTSIPLIFFAAAAQRLQYSTMGFFQYIAPSIMFLCAIGLYNEPLSTDKLITFVCIWTALGLLTLEAIRNQRKNTKRSQAITG